MGYCINRTESNKFHMPIKTVKERNRFLDFAKHLMVEYIAFLDEKEKGSANYRDHSAQDVRDAYGELWGNVRSWEDTMDCLTRFLTDTWDCPFELEIVGGGEYVSFEFDFVSGGKWYGDDELVFIKAFAPFAEEGAFIGFEGEDNALWSYVYDGKGGYRECFPTIDWKAGYKAPEKAEEEGPWIKLTLGSMASWEDWETVCYMANVAPQDAASVTLHVSKAEWEEAE